MNASKCKRRSERVGAWEALAPGVLAGKMEEGAAGRGCGWPLETGTSPTSSRRQDLDPTRNWILTAAWMTLKVDSSPPPPLCKLLEEFGPDDIFILALWDTQQRTTWTTLGWDSSDLQELWGNQFVVFRLFNLWQFVTAPMENQYTWYCCSQEHNLRITGLSFLSVLLLPVYRLLKKFTHFLCFPYFRE